MCLFTPQNAEFSSCDRITWARGGVWDTLQPARTEAAEMEAVNWCGRPREEVMAGASLKLREGNFTCSFYFYQRGLMMCADARFAQWRRGNAQQLSAEFVLLHYFGPICQLTPRERLC